MNNKRGQAALEFLMTYGWAILVVLIAIGALAYFGVLNPKGILPKTCIIAPGFNCDDFSVKTDGTATMIIRNGLGKDLSNITITLESQSGTCLPAEPWKAGKQLTCTYTGLTTGTEGNQYSEDILLEYAEDGS